MNLPNNQDPLTAEEIEKLFSALEKICQSVETWISNGAVDESQDDERINQSQRRIDQMGAKLAREKQNIRKLRSYIQRRKRFVRSPSDHGK